MTWPSARLYKQDAKCISKVVPGHASGAASLGHKGPTITTLGFRDLGFRVQVPKTIQITASRP